MISIYIIYMYVNTDTCAKLNTSFLDHRYSCAPLFFASIMAAYLPPHIATSHVTASVIRAAPMTIVCGEMAIAGALLIAAWGRCRGAFASTCCKVGVVLALCLHLGIALTPPPNNVGAFSVIMAVRLVFFAPRASAQVLLDSLLPCSGSAIFWSALALGLACAATALAALPDHDIATTGGIGELGIMVYKGLDWSVPTFVLIMCIVGGGALRGTATDNTRHHIGISTGGTGLVCLAVIHSLLVTPLGLQDLGGPNMYSNLRMQGGSNHLLLPTALLHDAHKRALFSAVADRHYHGWSAILAGAFDGGLVRIENSTSSCINALYPGEISTVHSERARKMLRDAGHSGRQFNPAMGRVLGSWVLPPMDTSKPFPRYTVPTLEFRRMIKKIKSIKLKIKNLSQVHSASFGISAHALRGQTST